MAKSLNEILDLSYELYEAHHQLLHLKHMAETVINEYHASLQIVAEYDRILKNEKNVAEAQNNKLETIRNARNRLETLSQTVDAVWNQQSQKLLNERELHLNTSSQNPAAVTNQKLDQIKRLEQQGSYNHDINRHFALLTYIDETISDLQFSQDELNTYTAEQIVYLDYYLKNLIKAFNDFERSMINMDEVIRKQYKPKQITNKQKEAYNRALWIVNNKDSTIAEWENTKLSLQAKRDNKKSELISALEEALLEKDELRHQAKNNARSVVATIISRAQEDLSWKMPKETFNQDILYRAPTAKIMHSRFSKSYPFAKADDFYRTLESKAHYYWQRSEFFKGEKDSKAKQQLYYDLFLAFSHEMNEYMKHENITPADCLHSLSQKVADLETTLELNEGRSAIARALRWIQKLLGMIDQRELTKPIQVSAIPQTFFDNPSTKTMEDLSEAKNLGQKSVK